MKPIICAIVVASLVWKSNQAGAQTTSPPRNAPADPTSIRPFRVHVAAEQLADMRRKIAETRWPEKETVGDETQGVKLETMQTLARYWATDYDWRKVETRLNELPQFITEIDGLEFTSFTCVPDTLMRCH